MSLTKPKILCVDDEEIVLEALEYLLKREGYDILKAANGEEALKKLREEKVDLVLLDVRMPQTDGFEVCRRIKADENSMGIPVVLMTGLTSKEDRVIGIEAGAEDFISKPYDNAEVLARIKMLLKAKIVQEKRIGELLIDMDFIKDEQLQEALRIAKERGIKVGEALLSMGALDKDHIYWVLSYQLNMNYIEPSLDMIDREWVRQFPIATLKDLQCLPLYETAGETHFAIADPTNQEVRQAVENLSRGKKPRLHLALPEKIGSILEKIKQELYTPRPKFEADAQALNAFPFVGGKSPDPVKKEKHWHTLVEVLFSLSAHETAWLSSDGQTCHFISGKGNDFKTLDQYSPEAFDLIKQRLKREIKPRTGKGVGYLMVQKKIPDGPGAFKIWFMNALGKELIKIGRLPVFSQEEFFIAHPGALAFVGELQQLFQDSRCLLIGGPERLVIKQFCYCLWRMQGFIRKFPPTFFVEDELEMVFSEVTQLANGQFDLINFLNPAPGHLNPFVFYEAPFPEISAELRKILSGHPQNIILSIPFSSGESLASALQTCPERQRAKFRAIFLQGDHWKEI